MAVRFLTTKRCRSVAWRGVFVCALLLVGAYVVFDVLDVDGSQMSGWPGGDMIAAETQQASTDRLFRADFSAPGPTNLLPALPRLSSTEIRGSSPTPTVLRIRQSRLIPRVNLHRELARTNSSIADPA
jgi:hypothetical protein